MNDLIIIGAGAAGREVYSIAKDIINISNKRKFRVIGFLDDTTELDDIVIDGLRVIGTVKDWEPKENDVFICSITNQKYRKIIIESFINKNAHFINLIHPSSIINDNIIVGQGCVIYPFVWISTNVKLGNHIYINSRVSVGHDACVEDYTVISSFCDITGYVKIGKEVFLGSHVTIAPKTNIGNKSFIAIGSIVLNDVNENSKVIGYPAKKYNI